MGNMKLLILNADKKKQIKYKKHLILEYRFIQRNINVI